MLLGGPSASAFAKMMAPFGMRLEVLGTSTIGAAAAVKMCRSIIVKGLEALMCECVLGASRYGADEYVFESLNESFPGIDWKKLVDYMVGRVAVHGERRAREMERSERHTTRHRHRADLAEATARRQDWSARLGLRSQFGPDGPKTCQEVRDALARMTQEVPSCGSG
jgi:3-hydroxyisobutyrate dehydrogenase-like beta-hydroxyacid dehydrogenase